MNRVIIYSLAGLASLLPVLVDSALKGVLLLALVGLVAISMRTASAAARHLAWMAGIAGLMVLPLLSAGLPQWRVLPAWASVPLLSRESNLQSDAVRLDTDALAASTARMAARSEAPDPASSARIQQISFGPYSWLTGRTSRNRSSWIIGIWILGVSALAIRMLACLVWLQVSARRAQIVTTGPLMEALDSARAQLGIPRTVKLFVDHRRIIPLVWGILRPCLVLPEEAHTWEAPRLRAVLLHELAHVKRNDLLVLLLTQAACAMHWFNPLVWLAAWQLHEERERACDDLVLDAGVEAPDYAEHLLHVATELQVATAPGALAMARPSRLKCRLAAILNDRLNRGEATRKLTFAMVALAMGIAVPVAMLRAADEQNPPADTAGAEPAKPKDETKPVPPTPPQLDKTPPEQNRRELDATRERLRKAELQLERARLLFQQGRLSEAEHERARAEVDLQQLELKTRAEKLDRSKKEDADLAVKKWKKVRDAELDKANDVLDAPKGDWAGRDLDKTRAEAAAVSAELDRVRKDYEGMARILSDKNASEADLQRTRAMAAANEAKTRYIAQQDNSEVARAELDIARASLEKAKSNQNRTKALAEQKVIPVDEQEQSKAEVAQAEANVRLAEARLKQSMMADTQAKDSVANDRKKDRVRELLNEEIKIAADQTRIAREQHRQGAAPLTEALSAESDLLALKRKLADIEGNRQQAKDLIREELRTLQDLEKVVSKQQEAGVVSEAEILKVRRQILSLQRQEAELE